MDYSKLIRIVALVSIAVVMANILLFAFHVYSDTAMWIVLVIAAVIAWPGLNWLKKKAALQKPVASRKRRK